MSETLSGEVHISIICANHFVHECTVHLIIKLMEVMGNMKEKEGLGDMGEGDIEEEIERRKY